VRGNYIHERRESYSFFEFDRFCEQLHAATNPARKKLEHSKTYNVKMARGWESKSVEAQQEEATQKSETRRPPMTAEEAAHSREKESLRLSRQRVVEQMQASSNPRHRKLLQDALSDLDEKLKKLA
jgi:signal recognition particle GTPase